MTAITIRDVPEATRAELAVRAARNGQSMQEYLRAELVALASRPTVADVLDRAAQQVKAMGSHLSAEQILAARDADRR